MIKLWFLPWSCFLMLIWSTYPQDLIWIFLPPHKLLQGLLHKKWETWEPDGTKKKGKISQKMLQWQKYYKIVVFILASYIQGLVALEIFWLKLRAAWFWKALLSHYKIESSIVYKAYNYNVKELCAFKRSGSSIVLHPTFFTIAASDHGGLILCIWQVATYYGRHVAQLKAISIFYWQLQVGLQGTDCKDFEIAIHWGSMVNTIAMDCI